AQTTLWPKHQSWAGKCLLLLLTSWMLAAWASSRIQLEQSSACGRPKSTVGLVLLERRVLSAGPTWLLLIRQARKSSIPVCLAGRRKKTRRRTIPAICTSTRGAITLAEFHRLSVTQTYLRTG